MHFGKSAKLKLQKFSFLLNDIVNLVHSAKSFEDVYDIVNTNVGLSNYYRDMYDDQTRARLERLEEFRTSFCNFQQDVFH